VALIEREVQESGPTLPTSYSKLPRLRSCGTLKGVTTSPWDRRPRLCHRLDDFGTGFGTFTHVKKLDIKYLKIDIEFVRD